MSSHRDRSHWFHTGGAYISSEPLQSDISVDVCVIGGGINGLSTAYHLKLLEPSTEVALVEGQVVGFGASGRNAGQLIVHFGGGDPGAHVRRFGAANVGAAWNYVAEGVSLLSSLQKAEGLSFDYQETGYLQAGWRAEPAVLEDHQRFLEAIGQAGGMTQVTADQMAREFDSPLLGAGLFDPRGGQFNPLKLTRGLKAAAERRGARIFEHSPVVAIDLSGRAIVVRTASGSVRCAKLVLATNAYTHLVPGLNRLRGDRWQNPMMVHASITEPLSQEQWAAVRWTRRCGVNMISDLFYSFAPTHDGRLLYVGGYHLSSPYGRRLGPEVSPAFRRDGHDHLQRVFPALAGLRTVQTWGGPISTTMDTLPHVGLSDDPRVAYAVGCWGHGVPIGARNGRTLAELSLDRATDSTDLWFVRRRKDLWLDRTLASFATRRVVDLKRADIRKLGLSMRPPLRFGPPGRP